MNARNFTAEGAEILTTEGTEDTEKGQAIELFPGFKVPPFEIEPPAKKAMRELRERYLALPEVQMYRGYGSVRNWAIFKNFVEGLRGAIRLWKSKPGDYRSLNKVIWDATGELPEGGQLVDFNERKQRFYLRNGLMDLAILLCKEIEAREETEKVVNP